MLSVEIRTNENTMAKKVNKIVSVTYDW